MASHTELFDAIKQALHSCHDAVKMYIGLTKALEAAGIPHNQGQPYVPFTYRPYTQHNMLLFGDRNTSLYIDGDKCTHRIFITSILDHPSLSELKVKVDTGASDIYIINIRSGRSIHTFITTGDKILTAEQRFSALKTIRKMRETLKELGQDQTYRIPVSNEIIIKPNASLLENTNNLEETARIIFSDFAFKQRTQIPLDENLHAFMQEMYRSTD